MKSLFRPRRSLVRTKAVSSQLETTPTQELPSASEQVTSVNQRCRMQSVLTLMTSAYISEQDTRVAAICEQGRSSGTAHLGSRIFDQSRSEIDSQHPRGLCGDLQGSSTSMFAPRNCSTASNNWIKLGRASRSASIPGCWILMQTVPARAARLLRFRIPHQLEAVR